MAAPPSGFELHRFTRSSRSALAWAASRAEARARVAAGASSASGTAASGTTAAAGGGAPVRVTGPDLLTGILLAHPGTSEPLLLIRHAGAPPDMLDSLLAPTGFTTRNAGRPRGELKSMPPLDDEAERIVARAVALAETLNPTPERLVRLRELFGGVLEERGAARDILERALASSDVSLEEVRRLYPEFLSPDARSAKFDVFLRERLAGPQQAREQVQTKEQVQAQEQVQAPSASERESPTPGRRFAIVDPDLPTGEDLVGIGAEVDALAHLIAAPALQPPLAIGLFGDWGSGKSFFMEALRRRVDALTAAARESGLPQRDLGVYRHVAQIEFNAWHYVDGNLWASLVEHIFQSLAGDDDETGLEERLRAWKVELETQQVARADVRRRLQSMRAEQTDRAAALEESRERRKEMMQALQETRARDVLAAVALDEDVRRSVEELLSDVGLSALRDSALDARDALDDARTLLQRGNPLLTPLRQRGRSGWKWALMLVLVSLAGPAVAWGLDLIPQVAVDGVTRTFTGVAAFLSSLALLLRRGSGWLAGSLQRVQEAQANLVRLRERQAGELARQEAEIQHELDMLDAEIARLADQKAELDARIQRIEADLAALTPTRVLSEFIDERVDSDDYRKHLGVPALVRRDFRRLSSLVKAQNDALLAGEEVGQSGAPAVNRVVLYIDDLDRCPPDRVVAVLQAVHLLLAFDLFVVLVAVDSRWLSRALLSHYQALLGELADGNGAERATPDDYLEKIFQIPFHVRPLSDEAKQRILHGLLDHGGQAIPTPRGPGVDAAGPDLAGEPSASDGVDPGAARDDDASEAADDDAFGDSGRAVEARGQPAGASDGDLETVDLSPERLRIRSGESAFMEDLRPLLGRTPRAVKRFVNVYRILAAVAESRGEPFYIEPSELAGGAKSKGDAGDPPDAGEIPAYRLAMFLLAVVTGLPDLSPEVLRIIAAGAAAVRRGDRKAQDVTMGWVLTQYAAGGSVLRPEGPSPEYRRLKAWLDQYDDGAWNRLPLERLEPWVDAVSRFSFRSEVGAAG